MFQQSIEKDTSLLSKISLYDDFQAGFNACRDYLISSATVVYGDVTHQDWYLAEMGATHKALLIQVESIVKECVKHEPTDVSINEKERFVSKCKRGVEIVAEWKQK